MVRRAGRKLVRKTAANATGFGDTALTANTTYYYRVKAHNSTGDSAYTNVVSATTTVWVVSVAVDDGLGTTANTLSQALSPSYRRANYLLYDQC